MNNGCAKRREDDTSMKDKRQPHIGSGQVGTAVSVDSSCMARVQHARSCQTSRNAETDNDDGMLGNDMITGKRVNFDQFEKELTSMTKPRTNC